VFVGYLLCGACGHRTPEFMCIYHHAPQADGYEVLLQDRVTGALRLARIPNDEVFSFDPEVDEDEHSRRVDRYEEGVIASQAAPTERRVRVGEFLGDDSIGVACPQCRGVMRWQNIGIV
jgi:hypothetical protein